MSPSSRRAWIEISRRGGVDAVVDGSPSSRRAWIEISISLQWLAEVFVALLAEGVDRNLVAVYVYDDNRMSPSSRRAWIEISWSCKAMPMWRVALLAEGVDRNYYSRFKGDFKMVVALLAEGVDRNC